jgi:hypothetical protein
MFENNALNRFVENAIQGEAFLAHCQSVSALLTLETGNGFAVKGG